jgi:hypothetical protein
MEHQENSMKLGISHRRRSAAEALQQTGAYKEIFAPHNIERCDEPLRHTSVPLDHRSF